MSLAPYISSSDKGRLMQRLDATRRSWSTYAPYLDWFRTELNDIPALPPEQVPGDVITMNSRFDILNLRSGRASTCTLVFPEDDSGHMHSEPISILSQQGMALLGARVGDIVRWAGDDTFEAAKVVRLLYQPESAGDRNG